MPSMSQRKWHVCIPSGRWMAGVNSFGTKARSQSFMDRYNDAEEKSGKSPLVWTRTPGTQEFVGTDPGKGAIVVATQEFAR